MSAKRTRAVLLVAFAISLLLHAILAGALRWPFDLRLHEEVIPKVRIIHIARVTPPTVAPTPSPHPTNTSKVLPPSVTHRGKGPAAVLRTAAPRPTPTSTPLVRPSPKGSASPAPTIGPCNGHLNADPTVAATADPVPLSPQARASKASGTAQVRVTLDAQGRVVQTAIAQSAGDAGLDDVAVQMARNATYTPKYVACKAVSGDYVF
jgi:TonB family protein